MEKMAVSMVTSGRDLIDSRNKPERASNQIATLFVDPDYDTFKANQEPLQLASVTSASSAPPLRGTLGDLPCLASDYVPLPHTAMEGDAVSALLLSHGYQNLDIYSKETASETNLKGMTYSPSILHIASHGFYCESDRKLRKALNPLLFSGLVFAGANGAIDRSPSDPVQIDDGLLTALELSSLNLSETELVVLSACQTGLGEVRTGEGVYGLRRAILLAGADAALTSMFKIPDKAAEQLVTDFYSNWLGGMSRAEALRAASLTRLRAEREHGRAGHPMFWGGFILVGDPD